MRRFRVVYGKRGSSTGRNTGQNETRGVFLEPAYRKVVKRDEDGSALRDEKGRKRWERVEWSNVVCARDRERAIRAARARAPHGMKVVQIQEVAA